MKISSRLIFRRALGSFFALAALLPVSSRADIAIVIEEFADKVVVRYSGSLNTTSYASNPDFWGATLDPGAPQIMFADIPSSPAGSFRTVTGDPVTTNASTFGTGIGSIPSVFSGDYFVISNVLLAYPNGYVSGSPLSGSMTFSGATLESLGIDRNLDPAYFWGLSSGEKVTLELVAGAKKLQQIATKKAALLKAMRKLNKNLSAAIRSGKMARVAKLKRSIAKITKQISEL